MPEQHTDGSPPSHWFEPVAEHLGAAYLRYSFTRGTVQEIDALTDMVGLAPGSRVLDVGCGPGRHSLELARRGHQVTGVDISAVFVDLAERATAHEGLEDRTRFIRADAGRLGELGLGSFDLVISLCQGAFGLTGGPAADATAADAATPASPIATEVDEPFELDEPLELDEPILSAMAASLAERGHLVVSAFSAYFQLRHTDADRPNGSPSVDLPAESFDADSGVNHEWTTVLDPNGTPRTTELWTTCYTPRELRLLARAVGLRVRAVHGVTPGDYGPRRPDVDRPEFLLVASRDPEKHR